MAVEVLSPEDCLKHSQQAIVNLNRNPNRVRSSPQINRKNRRQVRKNINKNQPGPVQKAPVPNTLVMGQVKLLRRGEEVPVTAPNRPPPPRPQPKKHNPNPQVPDIGSTNRLGPDPNRVPRNTKHPEPNRASGFYAGSSSCVASPPPSSLPVPSFFAKKGVVSSTDEAASELLKLLRINLS